MIHSGSRNVGNKVATYFNNEAVRLNEEWSWDLKIPKNWQLAFLPMVGKNKHLGEAYMREMNWCLDFAEASRVIMMERIMDAFVKHLPEVLFDKELDCHHNFASLENHFGNNVIIHRKGATSAKMGEIGIIPGSQGTASYIVKGLGNKDSFFSSSHGAGRVLSRTEAKKTLNISEEIKKLEEKGILHSIRNQNDLEEAAGAYKNIDDVMECQKDIVCPITKLLPLAVIKG